MSKMRQERDGGTLHWSSFSTCFVREWKSLVETNQTVPIIAIAGLNPKQFEQIPGSGENFKESRRDTVGTPVKKKKEKGKECESLKVGERDRCHWWWCCFCPSWEDPTAQTQSQGSGCGEVALPP